MKRFSMKRIADPIHGSIGLSELELAVINSKVFQRLRNIKQLGLAYLVFQGADYSRFSHSVGVCHVTGLIMESLRESGTAGTIDDRELQLYRLAGLLHDVGHYPFSHAMEHAIADHYSNKILEGAYTRYFKHEAVSKLISDN
jgi:HD superfamily phosphohydrolase